MSKERGEEYEAYRSTAPFMLPLPKVVSTVASAPTRFLLKKNRPENGRELLITFLVYAAILMVLSLPFVLLNWPPHLGWSDWPSLSYFRSAVRRSVMVSQADRCCTEFLMEHLWWT